MPEAQIPVAILGAGPAGLGAAYRLARRGPFAVTVLERQRALGGNAGSFELAGLRVDYGSHRLHPACPPEILADIRALLGEDLLERPRHGRMLLRGRWVHFPLKPLDLAAQLPLSFTLGVVRDAVFKFNGKTADQATFADVLRHGLGRTICEDFYFPYARKIWGVAPEELDAEQARRRVSAGSLGAMVRKVLHAVPGMRANGAGRFYYPRQGYGQISEAYGCAAAKAGAAIRLGAPVTGIELADRRVAAVRFRQEQEDMRLPVQLVLSTIPISLLATLADPPPPEPVRAAARALQFRAMLLIYLVLEAEQFTEFDAHYFPQPEIAITRLSEPKNYSGALLPGRTVLCAELPCAVSDPLWKASEAELQAVVVEALARAGLPVRAPISQVAVRRLPQAYPIYTRDYRRHLETLEGWAAGVQGLVSFGRQGLFAHDNTHHTLAMAYALSDVIDDDGRIDQQRWQAHRRQFERHVVED